MTSNQASLDATLHPDLMGDKEICKILEMRCIKIPNIEQLPRSQLLEIYSRVAIPLEQRRPRTNGHRSAPSTFPTDVSMDVDEHQNIKENPNNNLKRHIQIPKTQVNGAFRKIRIKSNSPCDVETNSTVCKTSNAVKGEVIVIPTNVKRPLNMDNNCDVPPSKLQRKKITWP